MVHRRELDGEPVVFGNQGDLWSNAMTWFDHDTGSIWSQVTGEAIMGPLRGERLELLPSTLTTWSDWRSRFPDTVALDADTRGTRFSLDQGSVVVELNDDSMAVPITELRKVDVVNETVGGEPIVVAMESGSNRWSVHSRKRGDRVAEFDLVDDQLVDRETGQRFDAQLGSALDGEGSDLAVIAGFASFPRDYVRIFPDGRIWTTEEVFQNSDFITSPG